MRRHTKFALQSLAFVFIAWLFSSCATNEGLSYRQNASSGDAEQNSEPNFKMAPRRPGLGTGWGDELHSQIDSTRYVRATSKPYGGTDLIYYNDKEGIDAMTKGSWKRKTNRMQRAANGLIEWGIETRGWGSKTYLSSGRRYVAGDKGEPYAIVVKNISFSRVEVVLSVDGLDVMDGKAASTRKRGYILDPDETLKVKGWRTSNSSIARFEFSSVNSSYSNLSNKGTRNIGVIGLAAFYEKGSSPFKWSKQEVSKRQNAQGFAEAPTKTAR